MIENIAGMPGIKGHIKLDLLDPDTQKVTESVEYDNAVMSSISKYWQTLQKIYWMAGNNNNGVGSTGRFITSPILGTHVMLTTDTTTPSTTTNSLSGELIGYASRWNVAVSGTKRGSLNTSLSSLSDTQSQFVWDWSAAAANGTFQTVSFGTVHNTTEKYLTEPHQLYTTGGVSTGWGGATTNNTANTQTAMCYSETTTYIAYPSGTNPATSGPVIVATIDPVNGGAPTVLFTCSGAGTLSPTSVWSMVRLSNGNFILGTSSGVTVVSSTGVFIGSTVVVTNASSLATDGTTVWGTTDNNAQVYTVNTSTGAFTALFNTNASSASQFAPKVAYDGTNLLVLCTNAAQTSFELRTYTTAGVLLSTSNNQWWPDRLTETAVSPYTGTISYMTDGGGKFDVAASSGTTANSGIGTLTGSGSPTPAIQPPLLSYATTNTVVVRRTSPYGLNWGPNGLWFKYYQVDVGASNLPGYGWAIYNISYRNVSTRALLDNPFTKTSSNALRLTYTISFT